MKSDFDIFTGNIVVTIRTKKGRYDEAKIAKISSAKIWNGLCQSSYKLYGVARMGKVMKLSHMINLIK